MAGSDDQALAARHLWRGAFSGVLSTQSLEHPGYPFGSVVPFAIDRAGNPLLLLSHLSQHTRNIDADGRCALTLGAGANGDVQQSPRLTALGDVRPAGADADAGRYLRYYPHARMYLEELGFRFYRFAALRLHWNGGFATARWFGRDRILRPNPFTAEEEARIVEHMNLDHADALAVYLADHLGGAPSAGVSMLGIDDEGIDLGLQEGHYRVPLARTVATPGEARAVLVEMAQRARRGS